MQARIRLRTLIAALAGAACIGCPADILQTDAGDQGTNRDSGPGDDASVDHTDPDSREAICAGCVEQRCTADAQACLDDEACLSIAACLESCQNAAECDACAASAPAQRDAATELATCRYGLCWLSCTSADWPPLGGAECQPPAGQCEPDVPGFEECCRGSCSDESGRCCLELGDSCQLAQECCGESTDVACVGEVCVARTCFEKTELCTSDRPCCDSGFTCVELSGGGGCCAGAGTQVSDGSDCCSGSSTTNAEGDTFCGA